MKTMRQKQVYSMIRNIVALTFIISGCSGLIHAFFNCSNYTFHENATEGRSWETSRMLCQNSSEGDLVSIEEEEERIFVKNIMKNLTTIKYFIGLKKDDGKWKWLSNQTTVNSSHGKSPWAPGQPSATPDRKDNCATIYGQYRGYLGRFDDMSCSRRMKNAGHICEKALSCAKNERGTSFPKNTTQVSPVHSTTIMSSQGQPSAYYTAEIESAALIMTHLEKADDSSNLIAIIVSVLASFVILGTAAALLLFLVYRSRKKAKQEMDDCKSLPEVKRQDACVTIEEGDDGSFLRMQESSTKIPKESLIEEESNTNSYSDPLHISAKTKPSKVVVKKVTPGQHQVYAQIHSKQDKAAYHLDHVMQDLYELPSKVIVDEDNSKPSAAISSAGFERELTRDEDAIVKQNASGQDQCIDCVYAVVDKTKKKRPPTKPAPYQKLVHADLIHSPKRSKNGRIHQESTATLSTTSRAAL